MHNNDKHWNHAHLLALALLTPYALAAQAAGWDAFTTLAVHLVATLAWFALFERWRPFRAAWQPAAADLRRDGAFLGVNAVADGLVGLLVAAIALRWAGSGPASAWPAWVAVPLAVGVAELAAYGVHRGMHAGGWWWRVHAVHHRPEALNVSNNLTAHPINVAVLKAVKMLPLLALGFSPEAVLAASLFLQLQSFATHANTSGRMGWLNYLVGTAELHRWHHSTQRGESLNFGTALPVWDQLFGTFVYRPGQAPQHVGVESPADYPGPTDLRALLLYPLRRAPSASGRAPARPAAP